LDGGRTGPDVYDAVESSLAANDCGTGCSWSAVYVRPGATPGDDVDLATLVDGGGIPTGAQGLRVEVHTEPETFFMRLVGINTVDVGTDATAMTSSLLEEAPSGVLLPITPFDSDYEVGVEYELTGGEEGPGNFGWLSWTGSNDPNTMADSICVPDNPALQFPVWIDGDPGVSNARRVRDCMDTWLGKTVLVPIWAQTAGPGNNLDYEIIKIAAFHLTDYDLHAVKVRGYFEEFYAIPGVPAGYGGPPCLSTDPNCSSRTNFIGLMR
jgi:hypothetical protein